MLQTLRPFILALAAVGSQKWKNTFYFSFQPLWVVFYWFILCTLCQRSADNIDILIFYEEHMKNIDLKNKLYSSIVTVADISSLKISDSSYLSYLSCPTDHLLHDNSLVLWLPFLAFRCHICALVIILKAQKKGLMIVPHFSVENVYQSDSDAFSFLWH